MKRFFYPSLFLISSVLAFSSCNKTEEDNSLPKYPSVRDAMASEAPRPVTITVDASTGGRFAIGKSTLVVPPNSFKTFFGAPVAGNVTVEALEIITKSDMAFSRILPVSNDEQLVTAGEFRLKATQNGTTLQMNGPQHLEIWVPQFGLTSAGMQYYQGKQTNDSSANTTTWLPNNLLTNYGAVAISGDTVRIMPDSIGFAGAARLLNKTNYQSFTVTVVPPTGITVKAEQVMGYVFYDAYRAVWPLSKFLNSQFSEFKVSKIPVHFVVFCVASDGNFYAGIGIGVPSNNMDYKVKLNLSTPAVFKAQVDEL